MFKNETLLPLEEIVEAFYAIYSILYSIYSKYAACF